MTEQVWEQVWLGAAGAVALVALAVAVLAHRRARGAESRARSLADALAQSLAESVREPGGPAAQPPAADAGDTAFVITHLGDVEAEETAARPIARPVDGRLFTDIVARETVVRAAGWTHGLRRALSAESRNRIRFAVRQETRRAGRERRSEMKQALREFRARERAAARPDLGEDVA